MIVNDQMLKKMAQFLKQKKQNLANVKILTKCSSNSFVNAKDLEYI